MRGYLHVGRKKDAGENVGVELVVEKGVDCVWTKEDAGKYPLSDCRARVSPIDLTRPGMNGLYPTQPRIKALQ